MTRSIWKGPFIDPKLLLSISQRTTNTYGRNSVIPPSFVGRIFEIYNGKNFIKVKITEEMVGHKLGEFAPTKLKKK
jgi:small subunit ribosomal protein S19